MTAVVAVGLALAAPLTTALLWNRPRRRWVRIGLRTAALASTQALALLAAALLLNRDYQFYSSWSELFGAPTLHSAIESGHPSRALDAADSRRLVDAFRAGHGTVLPWRVISNVPGVPHSEPGLVYLPAAYGDPSAATQQFPVVELLDGFPGTPGTWTNALHVQQTLDTLIARHESLPFIAVMPTQNVAYPHDTECVNQLDGPATDTYLTSAVRAQVLADFRALPQRSAWSLMGYSTGGYCAMNLAMRHPDLYAAAVSMSGTDRPSRDRTTGSLFGSDVALQEANTPLWESLHWPARDERWGPLDILAVAGRQERIVYLMAERLARDSRGSLHVTALLIDHGTHNAKMWTAVEPLAFNWLSAHLTGALVTLVPHGARFYVPSHAGGASPTVAIGRHPRIVTQQANRPTIIQPTQRTRTG